MIVMGDNGDDILVRVDTSDIDIFNKILEGYDHLCLVTVIDPARGELAVRVTPDTRSDTLNIIKHLPIPVTILHE